MDIEKDPDKTGNNRRKDGTFKAGVSGNPNGRPKGSRSIADILRKVGQEETPVALMNEVENIYDSTISADDLKDMNLMEGLLRIVFFHAMSGKSWAVQFIADRLEGKAKEHIEQKIIKDELIVE